MQEAYGTFCFALQGWQTTVTSVGVKTTGEKAAWLRWTEIPRTEENREDNKEANRQT